MGTRMAKLTPSRGFCAELATALVILVASQYGLPTSSSQCITGGAQGAGGGRAQGAGGGRAQGAGGGQQVGRGSVFSPYWPASVGAGQGWRRPWKAWEKAGGGGRRNEWSGRARGVGGKGTGEAAFGEQTGRGLCCVSVLYLVWHMLPPLAMHPVLILMPPPHCPPLPTASGS